ncbi:MAG: succinylglutamate desuccinylase/aspartoacylase family protein [bacterium]|nr:succinylglutamate desuccinylase/aspartoacylase family protein [bacterium]
MQILPSLDPTKAPFLTVVCCVHGNEYFGLTVFNALKNNTQERQDIVLILANEEAMEKDVRFVESDLNRSFPGRADGSKEERLAAALLSEIARTRYVLDIHTTTAAIRLLPIISNLDEDTKRIVHFTDAEEVAYMNRAMSEHALIGQVLAGVSLEYGDRYAETPEALSGVISLIDHLRSEEDGATPRPRKLFHVTGMIEKTIDLPPDAKDFDFLPAASAYPILLHEHAYADRFHALKAERVEDVTI